MTADGITNALALFGLAVSLLASASAIGWKMGRLHETVCALESKVDWLIKPNGHRFPECAVHEERIQELGRRLEAVEVLSASHDTTKQDRPQ